MEYFDIDKSLQENHLDSAPDSARNNNHKKKDIKEGNAISAPYQDIVDLTQEIHQDFHGASSILAAKTFEQKSATMYQTCMQQILSAESSLEWLRAVASVSRRDDMPWG